MPPAGCRAPRRRSSGNCCVAKHRFSRTRPLSTDCGDVNGTTMPSPVPRPLSILPKATISCGTVCTWPRRAWTAAAAALAAVGRGLSSPGRAPRGKPEAQKGGSFRLFPRSGDMARCMNFMPLTPSISEWCILMNRAKRPPASPSMMVHSHGGRLRSSGVLCRRPTSSPSSRSPPGQGSAACRTWYSRSIASSSIQTGSGFLLNAYFRRRFQGAANCRWPRNAAIRRCM